MTDSHWSRISSLFDQALALSGEERRSFVERESGSDADLVEEVMQLLDLHETDDPLPRVSTLTDLEDEVRHTDGLEVEIPRHRLLEILGVGVWELSISPSRPSRYEEG